MSEPKISQWTISGEPPDFNKLADAALAIIRESLIGLGAKREHVEANLPSHAVVKAHLEKNFAEESDC
jgi:hypothetical protein